MARRGHCMQIKDQEGAPSSTAFVPPTPKGCCFLWPRGSRRRARARNDRVRYRARYDQIFLAFFESVAYGLQDARWSHSSYPTAHTMAQQMIYFYLYTTYITTTKYCTHHHASAPAATYMHMNESSTHHSAHVRAACVAGKQSANRGMQEHIDDIHSA
jgi:hypothetical protein